MGEAATLARAALVTDPTFSPRSPLGHFWPDGEKGRQVLKVLRGLIGHLAELPLCPRCQVQSEEIDRGHAPGRNHDAWRAELACGPRRCPRQAPQAENDDAR